MSECCCEEKKVQKLPERFSGCLLCGKPLRYDAAPSLRKCAVCGEEKLSDCACEDGHFVCDACHSAGLDEFFIPFLLESEEKCPQRLLEQVMALPRVHMHGPEHHVIVPCVLLTAFHNCGGGNDLRSDLSAALKRGKQVPYTVIQEDSQNHRSAGHSRQGTDAFHHPSSRWTFLRSRMTYDK